VLGAHPATCGCAACDGDDLPPAAATPVPVPALLPRVPAARSAALALEARYDGAPVVAGGAHDVIGAQRSQLDFDAAVASGFAPKATLYTRGTRVIDVGVENATSSRAEYDAMPSMIDAAGDFIGRIEAEHRRHEDVAASAIVFGVDGRAVWPGRLDAPIVFTETAFKGLCSKRGHQGADYLRRCPSDLRADNLNRWSTIIALRDDAARMTAEADAARTGKKSTWKPTMLRMRVRDTVVGTKKADQRTGVEAFAVVSASYAAFDVDKIARGLQLALDTKGRDGVKLAIEGQPIDLSTAKGTITYDGEKARFEVLFHTDVQPRHFVAGEFFKAGVVITTDDTGGGSVIVRSVVWQNLCLNLLIIDECSVPVARLMHLGDVSKLARKFRAAIAKALDTLKHFVARWGYACEEDVLAGARAATAKDIEIPAEPKDVAAGIFRGLIDSERFTAYPGRDVEGIVERLVARWQEDESGAVQQHGGLTRAAIVNAITRFAHMDLPALTDDPWMADQAQLEAGALLWGARKGAAPAPFAFVPELVDEAPASGAAATAKA